MSQTPVNVKFALPAKPGFTGRPNVVQIIQSNPVTSGQALIQQSSPSYKTLPTVRTFVTGAPVIPVNTNTAIQYVRKPAEITVLNPGAAFVAASGAQQFSSFGGNPVMTINPNVMQSLSVAPGLTPANVNPLGGPGSVLSSLANSRKPCNCTKSHCLKLYCECFAQGQLCQNCNCNNCMNNLAYEEERGRAIKMTLERNPTAFHPKIGRGEGERKHTKGCNCKRSGCLKNYCECYEAKISCSDLCRCQGCRNTEDSVERRSLMRLAAMGALRSRQPASFKKHLIKPHPETLPHVFFTWEVIEATASCLLAQAEEAERRDLPHAAQERILLEEFGRILEHVIDSASKARVRSSDSAQGGESDDESLLRAGGPPSYGVRSGNPAAVGAATAAAAAADVLLRDDEEEDAIMRDVGVEDEDDGGALDDDMFDDEDDVGRDELSAQHLPRQSRHSSSRQRGRGQVETMLDEDLSDDDDLGPDSAGHMSGSFGSHKYRQQQQSHHSHSVESRYPSLRSRRAATSRTSGRDPDSMV